MTPGARLSAAIEVIADIDARRRPAADALKDWGLAHRFAGSGDRAAIAGLTYDALRRRASCAHVMGEASPRALVLAMLRLERKLDPDAIGRLADGARFAPAPLSEEERARLTAANLDDAPPWVAGDYPEWLDPQLAGVFGAERVAEGAALASRAPLDLRVNALKGGRDKALAALAHLDPGPTRWSPLGLRIALAADAKSPAIHAEPAFIKGMIEVQDEGSQLAALLAGAKPGEQVVDLCAGAGGKTLALAAMMENRGQLYATDLDKRRLAPIHQRLERAGVHNVQVRTPRAKDDVLGDLDHRIDLVLIDAPCTGSALGAAIPTPNGACGRARSRCGARSRPTRSSARPAWSRPAAASPTSPARCSPRRTATSSARSSSAIRNSRSCRRPRPRTRSANEPISSAARC